MSPGDKLPLSLQHSRWERHLFQRELQTSSQLHLLSGTSDEANHIADHQQIGSCPPVSPTCGDMNNHDPPPSYDMNVLLVLLKDSLPTAQPSFWAEVLHEHQIHPSVTDVDLFRSMLIQHLFSGACVSRPGLGCKNVVLHEHCPQSMGIHAIDAILEWMENGSLSLRECKHICNTLDLALDPSHMSRLIKKKLSDRRQHLFRVIESANIPLASLTSHPGSSSSAKSLKSFGIAHGVAISNADLREETTEKIFDHMTRGKCVESSGKNPGCKWTLVDPLLTLCSAVQLQVVVLSIIIETASKKQLLSVLDLHEINHDNADSLKMLKRHLKRYVQRIERGKLNDAYAEACATEKLRKLDDVRKNWPQLVPMQLKEKIIKDFRAATSSSALALFTCACCARKRPLHDRVRKSHCNVNLNLLRAPTEHQRNSSFVMPLTPFQEGPLKDALIDEHGVEVGSDGITLELCMSLSGPLTPVSS